MEIVIKTILWQIITHYAGTQDIIKKLASCDPCGRKSGLKTVAELLRLSILSNDNTGLWATDMHALSGRQAKRFCLSVCHLPMPSFV